MKAAREELVMQSSGLEGVRISPVNVSIRRERHRQEETARVPLQDYPQPRPLSSPSPPADSSQTRPVRQNRRTLSILACIQPFIHPEEPSRLEEGAAQPQYLSWQEIGLAARIKAFRRHGKSSF